MAGVSRRLLLVAPCAPRLDGRHGGARAVHGLASALAERHELLLVHLDRRDGPADPALAERCVAVHPVAAREVARWARRPHWGLALLRGQSLKGAGSGVPQLRRRVRELARSFAPEIVQVESGVIGDVLAAAGGALRIVTFYEPAASIGEIGAVRGPALPFVPALDARAALREERRVLRRADGVVAFTERDRALLERARGARSHAALVTIPLGWDVPPQALDPAGTEPGLVVFVANFIHPPNIDAALRLAQAIMPAVRATHPGAVLELVGAQPPEAVRELAGAGVRVTGPVASVEEHLERAAVVVAPLTIGGGMRVKVLEALAAGKAVVASTRAAEGISARAGEELVVVDGDDATAAAIAQLLGDPEARRRMGERARAWALRELSWAVMADRYDELYARLEADAGRAAGRGGAR